MENDVERRRLRNPRVSDESVRGSRRFLYEVLDWVSRNRVELSTAGGVSTMVGGGTLILGMAFQSPDVMLAGSAVTMAGIVVYSVIPNY